MLSSCSPYYVWSRKARTAEPVEFCPECGRGSRDTVLLLPQAESLSLVLRRSDTPDTASRWHSLVCRDTRDKLFWRCSHAPTCNVYWQPHLVARSKVDSIQHLSCGARYWPGKSYTAVRHPLSGLRQWRTSCRRPDEPARTGCRCSVCKSLFYEVRRSIFAWNKGNTELRLSVVGRCPFGSLGRLLELPAGST